MDSVRNNDYKAPHIIRIIKPSTNLPYEALYPLNEITSASLRVIFQSLPAVGKAKRNASARESLPIKALAIEAFNKTIVQ